MRAGFAASPPFLLFIMVGGAGMVTFRGPHGGRPITYLAEVAGREAMCLACGRHFVFPGPDQVQLAKGEATAGDAILINLPTAKPDSAKPVEPKSDKPSQGT